MSAQVYLVIRDSQGGEVRIPVDARMQSAEYIAARDQAAAEAADRSRLAAEAAARAAAAETVIAEAAARAAAAAAQETRRQTREWSRELREKALELVARGAKVADVADALGASYHTVYGWVKADRLRRPRVVTKRESVTVTFG